MQITLPDVFSSVKVNEGDASQIISAANGTTETVNILVTADCGITQEYSLTVSVDNEWNADPPKIKTHPMSGEYFFGDSVTLSIEAETEDGGTLTYQWYKNDAPVTGAANNTYKPPINEVGVFYYYCEVTNDISGIVIDGYDHLQDGGIKSRSVNSNTAVITIGVINAQFPEIETHPQSESCIFGDTTTALSVTAESNDDGELSYQWYRNIANNNTSGTSVGSANGGQTASYTPPITEVGTIYYYCEVTNTIPDNGDGGIKSRSVNSETAAITVNPRTITVSGTVSNTLSPIDSAVLVVKLENFLDNPGGIGLSVSVPTGVTHTSTGTPAPAYSNGVYTFEVTLDYNLSTNTAFANGTASIPVSVTGLPNTYTASSEDFTINIADGQADFTGAPNEVDRRIPVTQENIYEFNTYANSDNGLSRHYKLMEPVTLDPPVSPETSNWTPIGTGSGISSEGLLYLEGPNEGLDFSFKGSFDGGDHYIQGLAINDENKTLVGFFGLISGTVKNLTLKDVNINGYFAVGSVAGWLHNGRIESCYSYGSVSGLANTGGIAGVVYHNAIVESCHNFSNVTGNRGNSSFGGIVGSLGFNSAVRNCYNYGNIENNWEYVGGIVGVSHDGSEITNCHNEGNISGLSRVGGVVGGNGYDSYPGGTVENCYNTKNVNGNSAVGGIVGHNQDGIVNYCYNTGIITAETSNSGGIVGYNGWFNGTVEGIGKVENCVSLGTSVAGTSNVGRVVGNNISGSTLSNNYARQNMTGGTNSTDSNSIHGADVSANSNPASGGWNTLNFWDVTVNFDFNTVWQWNEEEEFTGANGRLPTLKGMTPDTIPRVP